MNKATIIYIFLPIFLSSIINLLFYTTNKKNEQDKSSITQRKNLKYLPPGYIIGAVWTILLGLMGYVYALLDRKNKNSTNEKSLLIFLVILCLLYPILTKNASLRYAKNYNYVTLIVVLVVLHAIYNTHPSISKYLIPLLFWVSYVNIITFLDDMKIINVF